MWHQIKDVLPAVVKSIYRAVEKEMKEEEKTNLKKLQKLERLAKKAEKKGQTMRAEELKDRISRLKNEEYCGISQS